MEEWLKTIENRDVGLRTLIRAVLPEVHALEKIRLNETLKLTFLLFISPLNISMACDS